MGTTRLTPTTARAAIEFVEDILRDVKIQWPAMSRSLSEYRAGCSGGGLGLVGRSSDVNDPTGRLACSHDPFARDAAKAAECIHALVAAAQELDRIRLRAQPARRIENGKVVPAPKACANIFGCPVARPAEPGRNGRCGSCYQYQRRHGGLDRTRARVTLIAV